MYFPDFFLFLLKPIYFSFDNVYLSNKICFIVFFLFAIFCAYLLFLFRQNVNIIFFKYKDLEIKLSGDDRYIFNNLFVFTLILRCIVKFSCLSGWTNPGRYGIMKIKIIRK